MSAPHPAPLADMALALHTLGERAEAEPLRWMRWTPPQDAWLRLQSKRKLLRAGNQIGKTIVGLAWIIQSSIDAPGESWIICTSWAQSVAIMRKFHDLCPQSVLAHGTSAYNQRIGYGKDSPAVIFTNGSIVRFRTTNQGPEALAGATVDRVLIDEATDQEIYRELDRRLMRKGGTMGITLTPVNRDCTWLHALVDEGVVDEVHAKLTVDNLTPIGASEPLRLLDGTPMDQTWIDEQWHKTPTTYAGVVLDGLWETRPEGTFFRCFDPNKHVASGTFDGTKAWWTMGLDYSAADRDDGQCAVLCHVVEQTDKYGKKEHYITVVDEVVLAGVATNEAFARAILDMLSARGLVWRDLRTVYGDNPVQSRWGYKSNVETSTYIAKALRVGKDHLQPPIFSAKEGSASKTLLDSRCRWLYEAIASDRVRVHPRCTKVIDGLQKWDYTRDHPSKDVLDATMYGLRSIIFPRGQSTGSTVKFR